MSIDEGDTYIVLKVADSVWKTQCAEVRNIWKEKGKQMDETEIERNKDKWIKIYKNGNKNKNQFKLSINLSYQDQVFYGSIMRLLKQR